MKLRLLLCANSFASSISTALLERHQCETILSCESFVPSYAVGCPCISNVNGFPQMSEIGLVPHEHDDDVAVGEVAQLLEPLLGVLERGVVGYVVHQQGAHRATVVT